MLTGGAGVANSRQLQLTESRRTFPRSKGQIPVARRFVRRVLAEWGVAEGTPRHDIVLCANELVTNAVIHGAGEVEMSLQLSPACLRLTVSDEGTSGIPLLAVTPVAGTIGGRGLRIVNRIASDWSSGRDDYGRTFVWVEVVLP